MTTAVNHISISIDGKEINGTYLFKGKEITVRFGAYEDKTHCELAPEALAKIMLSELYNKSIASAKASSQPSHTI